MATIFSEDFDGNGPGFKGSVFRSWSIGGVPVDAGHWGLFSGSQSSKPNKTPGNGGYTGVHSDSPEFIDTLVWLISPVIDARKYGELVLSADVYFQSRGAAAGEDKVEVLVLQPGKLPQTIGVIGDTMSAGDQPLQQNMSWNIPSSYRCGFIQIAFTWYSSMGPARYDSIQLDNIHLTGNRSFFCWLSSIFGR